MAIKCPTSFLTPSKLDFKTGRPASNLRIATPILDNTNHLLGHVLGGIRHVMLFNAVERPAGTQVFHFYCHRHPNCDYLDIRAFFRECEITAGSATFEATIGTGAATSFTRDYGGEVTGQYVLRAPWGASDSGDEFSSITFTNWFPYSFVVLDVPRDEIGTGDDRVEVIDSSYPAIALMERKVIGESALAGPKALTQGIIDAWDNYHPQIFSWAAPEDFKRSVATGAGWTNVFSGGPIRVKARKKRTTDTVRTATVYIRTGKDAGVTNYQFRVSSNTDTVTSGTFTNVGFEWKAGLTGLEIDCTADDTLTFEMSATGGSGNCHIQSICVIGDS